MIKALIASDPQPSRGDTDTRRDVMAGFTEAKNEALNHLSVNADDGQIIDAMARLATVADLIPR